MKKIRFQFAIGIILIIISWFFNWSLDGLRTHLLFFPLWFGYSLTIDALTFLRKGSSLLNRSKKKYFSLFLISAPAWWLFELLNLRTQNWMYDGKQFFSEWEYAIYATLSFSTVMPAVFGTAEFLSSFNRIKKLKNGIKFLPSKKNLLIMFLVGWIMLLLLLVMPEYFFVFVWLSVYFIVEPVNVWLKNRSLFDYVSIGSWSPVYSLWIGCLVCGFFWEMWNFYSYPKWIYHLPFGDVLHIFEMPLPGYLGYIPFSLELFAMHNLLAGLFKTQDKTYPEFN